MQNGVSPFGWVDVGYNPCFFFQKSTQHIAAKEKKRSAAGSKAHLFRGLAILAQRPAGATPLFFMGRVGNV